MLAAADEVKSEDPPVVSRTSVPQGLAQPLTIHDLKELIKELVESKQAGSAQDSDSLQLDAADAQVAEADANETNAFKTVEEVYVATAK